MQTVGLFYQHLARPIMRIRCTELSETNTTDYTWNSLGMKPMTGARDGVESTEHEFFPLIGKVLACSMSQVARLQVCMFRPVTHLQLYHAIESFHVCQGS
jgi:hypothetical protein